MIRWPIVVAVTAGAAAGVWLHRARECRRRAGSWAAHVERGPRVVPPTGER